MKRYLLLFIILLLPILVNAKTCDTSKVKITSIKMVDKSDTVVETEEATFSGLQTNLNLKFTEQGEHVEYKIIVKNDNTNDFELSKNTVKSDYFDYKYIYNDNTPIVKANSEKQINLRIDYSHPVPEELRDNFIEKKQIVLNLSNDNKITNPKTSRTTIIGLLLVLLGISTVIYVSKSKKVPTLLLLLVLLLPVGVFALCNVSITTNSKIELGNGGEEFCFIDRYVEESQPEYFKYEDGMTWRDYVASDYNVINDPNALYTYYFDTAIRAGNNSYKYKIPNVIKKTKQCTVVDCSYNVENTDEILDKSFGCYSWGEPSE